MVAINWHEKSLLPSTFDDVMLTIMLDAKYRELEELHRRVRGVSLSIPLDLHQAVLRCKHVLRRYRCQRCRSAQLAQNADGSPALNTKDKLPYCGRCSGRGDYRHSAAEKKSVREVAQWTLDVNNRLRNQPENILEWED